MLLKRPDGCKLAQKLLNTVWGPDRMNTSSERMMLIYLRGPDGKHVIQTDGCPDGMVRSSERMTGNLNSFDFQTLNSGISIYSIFTLK
jgi:hypothetical protein